MKIFRNIAILLLLPVAVIAQDSYLSIGLGAALPKGEFSSTENITGSGYAFSGFAIEIDGTYFPGSIFGISGMLGFGSFYTDQDEYIDNLESSIISGGNLPGFAWPADEAIDYTAGFWNYINFLAGPELSVSFWRLQLGLKGMGGVSVLISPKREIEYSGSVDNFSASTKGSDLSLSYLYGGSLMYKLRSGTALRLSADYLNTRADFKYSFIAETPVNDYIEASTYSTEIKSLQLLIGLTYTF